MKLPKRMTLHVAPAAMTPNESPDDLPIMRWMRLPRRMTLNVAPAAMAPDES